MKKFYDKLFSGITYSAAFFTIAALVGIIMSIVSEGIPIFQKVGVFSILFDSEWRPVDDPAIFGMWSLIVSSIYVTIGTLVIAIPLGLGSAIYISEIAGRRTKELIKPTIELLAGIPSVIYGLVGIVFLSPFLMNVFGLPVGLNLFSASLILGIMVIPIISTMSEDALNAVPQSLRDASYSLGANKFETIFKIVLPAAKSGVIGSFILAFGRAIGETLVVLMVAGGAAQIPKSIFAPVRPMTAAIAAEMGETVVGSDHYSALFAIAIILFAITFFTNIITELVFFGKKK
ncbi:MAG: phosphate ABC transporter permease subunit PstC [Candidatus Delongbacteria bacterium]|jgi:phosphate transport system permease protein|nr:phosphate ABC transporter permease subunit PstC [Candidatus Delongbacteria bacterium]